MHGREAWAGDAVLVDEGEAVWDEVPVWLGVLEEERETGPLSGPTMENCAFVKGLKEKILHHS
jgi:hypothetical protein